MASLGFVIVSKPTIFHHHGLYSKRTCGHQCQRTVRYEKQGLKSSYKFLPNRNISTLSEATNIDNNTTENQRPPTTENSTEAIETQSLNVSVSEEEQNVPEKKEGDGQRGKSVKGRRFRVVFDDIQVGSEFIGKVKKITSFGAFVDIGCFTDGLLHVSQMSDSFVKNPQDIVKVGDEIKPEKKEFSLSIKPPKTSSTTKEEKSNVEEEKSDSKTSSNMRPSASVLRLRRMGYNSNLSEATASPNDKVKPKGNKLPTASSSSLNTSVRVSLRKLAREVDEQKNSCFFNRFWSFCRFGGPTDGLIHLSEMTETVLERNESDQFEYWTRAQSSFIVYEPYGMSARKKLQEDLAAANENQPEFQSVLAIALERALQEKESELASKSR
eukprot:jgi/Galph1/1788/GphlegSOOS_G498.1